MTKSLEDYLEEIHVLILQKGKARVRDVAGDLNVKMPSVVKAISELKKLELVSQEPYGDIELTEKGRELAANVLGRHKLIKAFLVKLDVPEETADKDACLMEHVVSATTLDRIRAFVESPCKKRSPQKATTRKATK
ncbi:MAG: metal-dependent transcriptional regulator [Kiritimatiellae bacterium]|nr:metal-dependent transcriptional regulator [Kiritimatiellia bacterium]